MNHLILIGFMGSGKSSVGTMLAKHLQLPFVDTDQLIIKKAGMEITKIFERWGEEGFRRMETEVLRELSEEPARMVISAGGGLPVQPQNPPILKKMGTVILLDATVETLMERLRYDKSRPLIQGGDLRERIETLREARRPGYEAVSDVRVTTDGKNLRQVVQEICKITESGKN